MNVLDAVGGMRELADIQALDLNAAGIVAQRVKNHFDLCRWRNEAMKAACESKSKLVATNLRAQNPNQAFVFFVILLAFEINAFDLVLLLQKLVERARLLLKLRLELELIGRRAWQSPCSRLKDCHGSRGFSWLRRSQSGQNRCNLVVNDFTEQLVVGRC